MMLAYPVRAMARRTTMKSFEELFRIVSPIFARLLLVLIVAPFAILISASVFALVASQAGEYVATPVTIASLLAGGRGIAWWVSQINHADRE
jgi:hypothetical protein